MLTITAENGKTLILDSKQLSNPGFGDGLLVGGTKVKKLADVDVQKVENVREFIEITVTPGRLEQGLQVLKERKIPLEQQSTGIYLKWLVEDIITEELDTLVKNGLCAKDVNSAISNAGRAFWFKSIF